MAKKTSLGRGLNAILSSPETDITSKDISGNFVVGAVAEIPIKLIETNPYQPRNQFEENSLEQLSQSIKEQGIIQPITVRKMGYDTYQLISGERRLRASVMAGLETIPAFIRVADDNQMLEMAIIENIHREDLNAIEVALSYQRLMDECGMKLTDIAQKISQDRTTITNYVRLLKLPPIVQIAVRDKEITMGHARALISIDNEDLQEEILSKIINLGLSVRETENMVQQSQNKPQPIPRTGTNEAFIERYQSDIDHLSAAFKTKIEIKRNRNGKGQITIRFKDEDQLKTILKSMNKS